VELSLELRRAHSPAECRGRAGLAGSLVQRIAEALELSGGLLADVTRGAGFGNVVRQFLLHVSQHGAERLELRSVVHRFTSTSVAQWKQQVTARLLKGMPRAGRVRL
jgi:hypothetical protein